MNGGRTHPFVARLAFAGALAIGCADLPEVAPHVCGNHVVEPEAGEDCDTFSPKGTACIAPGEPNQCRYRCSLGENQDPACPSGMGCGSDGICRTASGRFDAVATTVEAKPHEILTADVDGDGRADVLSVERTALVAHYFDDLAALDASLVMPQKGTPACLPVVGELTGDRRADVVLPASLGIVVMIGTADRTQRPSAYPGITVTGGVDQLALMAARLNPDDLADEFVVLGTINGGSGLAYVPLTGVTDVLAVMPKGADSLAGPMLARNFDSRPSSPCDEAAVSYAGFDHVITYPLCSTDGSGRVSLNHTNVLGSVTLGGATIDGPTRVIDVNHDGRLDLVVLAKRGASDELDVAYGVGDGTFHSDGNALPPLSGDEAASRYATIAGDAPLAVGNLDGDDTLDYVTPTEIRTSENAAFGSASLTTNLGDPWTEAAVLDANADGFPDVVAVAETSRTVTFFNGAGNGLFTGTDLLTAGSPTDLTIGDYDGDHVPDLAVIEHQDPAQGGFGDTLSVLFGTHWGTPERPVAMGTIDPVLETLSALGRDPTSSMVDSAEDVVAMSKSDTGAFLFSSFSGSGDRILRSPYIMSQSTPVPGGAPILVGYFPVREALGEFTGDDHADLVTLARTLDSRTHIFWITPSTETARLHGDESGKSAPLPEDLDWTRSLMLAVDLDGDGVDEAVTLGHDASAPAHGLFAVARVATQPDGTQGISIDGPSPLDWAFDRREGADLTETPGSSGLVLDLDLDGRKDLAAIGTRGDSPETALLVFFNDGSGALPAPVEVPLDGSAPIELAALQADGDRAPELAVLVKGAVRIVDGDAHRRFSLRPKSIEVANDANLVGAGDVNGDGVDDLVVASPGAIQVYRGSASER